MKYAFCQQKMLIINIIIIYSSKENIIQNFENLCKVLIQQYEKQTFLLDNFFPIFNNELFDIKFFPNNSKFSGKINEGSPIN